MTVAELELEIHLLIPRAIFVRSPPLGFSKMFQWNMYHWYTAALNNTDSHSEENHSFFKLSDHLKEVLVWWYYVLNIRILFLLKKE